VQEIAQAMRISADIGGTFTDVTALDPLNWEVKTGKALTTPEDLATGVFDALSVAKVPLESSELFVHGSTVTINALIERRGARTVLVTTRGIRDLYAIGRVNRPDSFNLFFEKHRPLIPPEMIIEVSERLDAQGDVVIALTDSELRRLVAEVKGQQPEAIAILTLHSYREPKHEREIEQALRSAFPDVYISASHELIREYREFERTSTVVANAYVGPKSSSYLAALARRAQESGFAGDLMIMQSAGGLVDVKTAQREPIQLVESGPAGGVIGVAQLTQQLGIERAVSFDMGGTTAKACVVEGGLAALTSDDYFVGGYAAGLPLSIPVLDIKEIGTGGGSIAWLGEGGGLRVGPRSAGASPGPACYGLAGLEPTITDAHLVLNRLSAESFMGGSMKLDRDAALQAMRPVSDQVGMSREQVASGIIAIANAAMANAIRAVTVDRGLDPRDFVLVAYGGAGPLHAAELAMELSIDRVVIPPSPGHFSALGMLTADLRRDYSQTHFVPLDDVTVADVMAIFDRIEDDAQEWFSERNLSASDLQYLREADMRYIGQEHTVRVPIAAEAADSANGMAMIKASFDARHERLFRHSATEEPAEFVTFHSSVIARLPKVSLTAGAASEARQPANVPATRTVIFSEAEGPVDAAVWRREALSPGLGVNGPAVIEEAASTTLVPAGCVAQLSGDGLLWIDPKADLNA
jgi:N-methylhydantoinase A